MSRSHYEYEPFTLLISQFNWRSPMAFLVDLSMRDSYIHPRIDEINELCREPCANAISSTITFQTGTSIAGKAQKPGLLKFGEMTASQSNRTLHRKILPQTFLVHQFDYFGSEFKLSYFCFDGHFAYCLIDNIYSKSSKCIPKTLMA